jgi:hypothetical protein
MSEHCIAYRVGTDGGSERKGLQIMLLKHFYTGPEVKG